MSHPIDVGSVLGGRYKVTATVLTSHDQDLVLDGIDQVLNRPVSILVAGPGNAEQLAQSAREVATGERPGNVQILDLGISDSTTYLITNHSTAPDLLDLVVATNPPYVEPFFTDTLGSEIFGQARSYEPETYDGFYEDEHEAEYIQYDKASGQPEPDGAPVDSAAASAGPEPGIVNAPAQAAGPALRPARQQTPVVPARPVLPPAPSSPPAAAASVPTQQPTQPPVQAVPAPVRPATPPAREPKVSLWSEEDYGFTGGTGTGGTDRAAAAFPVQAAAADVDEDYYDDEPDREPRSLRWLVGGILAAVLVVGLILAVANLGSLLPGGTAASTAPTGSQSSAGTGAPSATATAVPSAPPVISDISRLGTFDFAATFDKDLARAFDGNAASYWSNMEFASEEWGGLAEEVPLVVKLKEPAEVKSVTLSQLGASGGSISVYTNDRPAMDGAKLVGTNSFTSPDLTLPLSEPTKTQYVIVVIKKLPKLAVSTKYGFGLRLAEVKVQ